MLKILNYRRQQGYLPRHFLPTTFITLGVYNQKINLANLKKFDIKVILLLKKIDNKNIISKNREDILGTYSSSRNDLIKRVVIILELTLESIGFPECNFKSIPKGNNSDKYLLTCDEIEGGRSNALSLLNVLVNWINSLIFSQCSESYADELNSKFSLLYEQTLESISKNAPKGVNTLKFIMAAKGLGIPCRRIVKNIFQFGLGKNSRWLDSSFTDSTPAISANFVRDKIICSHFLNEAGFPTPKNYVATSIENAVSIADKLGYPVVVKASNLDGGLGVYCDLKNGNEVRVAYEKVKKISKQVMVEEYIFGKDYRLQVCRDHVYWAIERKGPRVTGDGKSTIIELVNSFNKNRELENQTAEIQLPLIDFNDDVKYFLQKNGLTPNFIPPIGQEIKLRAANNIAGGGILVPALDIVHEDNIQLALDISRYLRLDLAGIDLLIPDISQSWKTQKCAVCEVNAMPQISGKRHQYLLEKIIPDSGKIPTILFLGDFEESQFHQKVIKVSKLKKLNIGIASHKEALLNAGRKISSFRNIYGSGFHLICDPTLDVLVHHMPFDSKLPLFFAVAEFDVIIVGDKITPSIEGAESLLWIKHLMAFSDHVISLRGEAKDLVDILKNVSQSIQDMRQKEFSDFLNDLIK